MDPLIEKYCDVKYDVMTTSFVEASLLMIEKLLDHIKKTDRIIIAYEIRGEKLPEQIRSQAYELQSVMASRIYQEVGNRLPGSGKERLSFEDFCLLRVEVATMGSHVIVFSSSYLSPNQVREFANITPFQSYEKGILKGFAAISMDGSVLHVDDHGRFTWIGNYSPTKEGTSILRPTEMGWAFLEKNNLDWQKIRAYFDQDVFHKWKTHEEWKQAGALASRDAGRIGFVRVQAPSIDQVVRGNVG